MSSNESAAYNIMRSLDVDYVLIIFGGVIGYSGDDINKFLWMVRIAEGEHPKDIRVSLTHTDGNISYFLLTSINLPSFPSHFLLICLFDSAALVCASFYFQSADEGYYFF